MVGLVRPVLVRVPAITCRVADEARNEPTVQEDVAGVGAIWPLGSNARTETVCCPCVASV
jgi:hypothetical protein